MDFKHWKQQQFDLGNLFISTTRNKGTVIGIWKTKYTRKKGAAKFSNLLFSLTFEEYLYKCFEAGLTSPDQIGRKTDSYQLSRYKDLGGYTIDNCRFITTKENLQERDDHFNISEMNLKRLEEGTHHFLDSSIMKKAARKRIENNNHTWINRRPWNSNKVNENSVKVWILAEDIINKHIETGWKCINLNRFFNLNSKKACDNVIKRYVQGWIPREDEEWVTFINNNTLASQGTGSIVPLQ